MSSATTLVLPQIAGGLIDARGLTAHEAQFLSGYYIAFLVAGAVWGLATATRFYFVTWLGERVVADIRKAVFDNVLGLTPQFFEVTRTGEVLSRLTADTTLIQTVVGSSASVAARNLVNLTGGLVLMFVTSPKLALLVVGAVVLVLVPMLVFGRWVRSLSRKSQDSIAETSARGRRDPQRGSHGAGFHPGKIRAPRIRRHGRTRFCRRPRAAPWRAPFSRRSRSSPPSPAWPPSRWWACTIS